MPPQSASHLLRAARRRPLAAKGSSERAESRCLRTRVPMGGARSRERPFHAASSVPRSSPHQMPPPERQPPLTTVHTAGALSRQNGRASGAESQCLRTRVPIGGTRSRERPFHAPPVAFSLPTSPHSFILFVHQPRRAPQTMPAPRPLRLCTPRTRRQKPLRRAAVAAVRLPPTLIIASRLLSYALLPCSVFRCAGGCCRGEPQASSRRRYRWSRRRRRCNCR